MEYEVVWTPRALDDIQTSLSYLEKEWSEKVAQGYYDKLKDALLFINRFPYSFALFMPAKKIRRCIVTKHNSVYFRISGLDIIILTIFDNRRDPELLQL